MDIIIHPSKYSGFCLSGFSETFLDINLNLVYFGDQMRDTEMWSNQINNWKHHSSIFMRPIHGYGAAAAEEAAEAAEAVVLSRRVFFYHHLSSRAVLRGKLHLSPQFWSTAHLGGGLYFCNFCIIFIFCIFCICVFFKVPGQQ